MSDQRHSCSTHHPCQKDKDIKKSPVAKIPWLPPHSSEKIEFEKSELYKIMGASCTASVAEQKRELYQILNETFPFYLPKRYHAMEFKELSEKCLNGQYWANAAHFLYATHAHDHRFYGIVNLIATNLDPNFNNDITQPVFNMGFKHEVLKNGSAECKTAAEYLLEPWVLLQLLTQPIIAYQWAIALVSEAIKIRTLVLEMTHFQLSENMQKCQDTLILISSNLYRLALELIALFHECASNQRYNHFFHTRRAHTKLHLMLKLYLPSISFLVSDECKNIITALKRMLSPEFYKTDATKSQQREQHFPIKLFTAGFWHANDINMVLDEYNPPTPTSIFDSEIFMDEADKISDETFTDILAGIFPKKEKDAIISNFLKDWTNIKEDKTPQPVIILNSNEELEDSENGVIYNLLRLNYNSESLLQNTFSVADDDDPVISLESIIETLCRAMEPCKENFTDYVKNIIKSESFSSNWEGMPDYKELGAEKSAQNFQDRIKSMVYKMTLEHNIGLEKTGPFTYHPEVLFIQYLLPCFVASFLDLDKDENASQMQKENYLRFLHELIKCYENHLFSYDLMDEWKFPITVVIRKSVLWFHLNDYRDDALEFFNSTLDGTKILEQIKQHFLLFMVEHNETMDCMGPPKYAWPTQQWHMYMLMLLSRIRTAAERVGWKGNSSAFCPLKMLSEMRHLDAKNMRDFEIVFELIQFRNIRSKTDREKAKKKKHTLPRELILAAKKITMPQLRAISISMLVASLEWKKQTARDFSQFQGPAFPLDPMYALWNIIKGQKWMAKIALLEKLVTEEREDPTLVTFAFAKTNKCYDFVFPRVTQEGKVKMRHPGEITFVPIKHCRWCGLAKVEKFRLCPECKENTDYPDVNFFCSENCEKEALEKQHTEEHARFLMQKCGY